MKTKAIEIGLVIAGLFLIALFVVGCEEKADAIEPNDVAISENVESKELTLRNSSDPRLICSGCYIRDGVYGCSMAESSKRAEAEYKERKRKEEEASIEREALVMSKAAQKLIDVSNISYANLEGRIADLEARIAALEGKKDKWKCTKCAKFDINEKYHICGITESPLSCKHLNLSKSTLRCTVLHYDDKDNILPACRICPDCGYHFGAYPGYGGPGWNYHGIRIYNPKIGGYRNVYGNKAEWCMENLACSTGKANKCEWNYCVAHPLEAKDPNECISNQIKESDIPYKCWFCYKTFKDKESYEKHTLARLKEKYPTEHWLQAYEPAPYNCGRCGGTATNAEGLAIHNCLSTTESNEQDELIPELTGAFQKDWPHRKYGHYGSDKRWWCERTQLWIYEDYKDPNE